MKKVTLWVVLFISTAAFSQIAFTDFEEPQDFTGTYTDSGDSSVPHDLVNNPDEPLVDFMPTGDEMGFSARYEPYDTPDVGLTDGDDVGVTGSEPSGFPFPSGEQGYEISDVDGNFILEFDPVMMGGGPGEAGIQYFISETGYEGDGTVNATGSDRLRIYVKDLTNSNEIDILDTTGSDINDLGIEGSWISGFAILLPNTNVQLVIEARNNAAVEGFFFDNIYFEGVLNASNFEKNNFSLYPNPASNGFVTIASENRENKEISIFDISGKQILNTSLEGELLNISKLKSGVYIVKIVQGGIITNKKLIVL